MHAIPISRHRAAISTAALVGGLVALAIAAPVFAHEERTVGAYDLEVGFIAEPVFVGDRSGLEIHVMKDGNPVEGLEKTLKAQVMVADATRDLELQAREEEPGWYESVFIPTAAGKYTFHLTGSIESQAIDESFTSSPTGFDEVREAAVGQFPNTLPTVAQLSSDATRGAGAADQLPIAILLGTAGAILGVVALAVALGGRRRPA
jgi:hypothetical protein